MMGAIKAKLEPRKMGTLPFVTRWKMNVPRKEGCCGVESDEQRHENCRTKGYEQELDADDCFTGCC